MLWIFGWYFRESDLVLQTLVKRGKCILNIEREFDLECLPSPEILSSTSVYLWMYTAHSRAFANNNQCYIASTITFSLTAQYGTQLKTLLSVAVMLGCLLSRMFLSFIPFDIPMSMILCMCDICVHVYVHKCTSLDCFDERVNDLWSGVASRTYLVSNWYWSWLRLNSFANPNFQFNARPDRGFEISGLYVLL